jgi:hypothetical protein
MRVYSKYCPKAIVTHAIHYRPATESFDDTAVVATDSDRATASHKLQTNLLAIQKWLKNES